MWDFNFSVISIYSCFWTGRCRLRRLLTNRLVRSFHLPKRAQNRPNSASGMPQARRKNRPCVFASPDSAWLLRTFLLYSDQKDQVSQNSHLQDAIIMMQVNILEAKTNFSKLIRLLETKKEDSITIARNGKPVAKITLIHDLRGQSALVLQEENSQ